MIFIRETLEAARNSNEAAERANEAAFCRCRCDSGDRRDTNKGPYFVRHSCQIDVRRIWMHKLILMS